jgi:phospholipase/carboxylesterase
MAIATGHKKNILSAGEPLGSAKRALIMLHGRGATAEDILSLSGFLKVKDFALLAPQATNFTWYPYSFMAPPEENEPWLSSALSLLHDLLTDLSTRGFPSKNIYLLGFSQGACLTLEFAARNARRFGGVVAFTGGLIGDRIYPEHYSGDFSGTPVFIGSSNPDPHVPVSRVQQTADLLKTMNAKVTEKIYPALGHTINQNEIDLANQLIFEAKG